MMSQSPFPMALSTPLDGYRTPPSYESTGSQNPYDYMPSTPGGCRFISDDSSSSSSIDSRDECENGDSVDRRGYKRTLPARAFLDLDDRDELPFFPTLSNTRSTKKLKPRRDPAELLAFSSLHGSIHMNSSSSSSAHTGDNTKLEPRLSLSGLRLGKQLRRRNSGVAPCA